MASQQHVPLTGHRASRPKLRPPEISLAELIGDTGLREDACRYAMRHHHCMRAIHRGATHLAAGVPVRERGLVPQANPSGHTVRADTDPVPWRPVPPGHEPACGCQPAGDGRGGLLPLPTQRPVGHPTLSTMMAI